MVGVQGYLRSSEEPPAPGAVEVFKRSDANSLFVRQTRIPQPGNDAGFFGTIIAVSGTGLAAATRKGAKLTVYIYRDIGQDWVQEDRFQAEGEYGGSALGIVGDSVALNVQSRGQDAIALYRRGEDAWKLAKLLQSPAPKDSGFGGGVTALVLTANELFVGASGESTSSAQHVGAVYVFRRVANDDFQFVQKLMSSDPHSEDRFGHVVVMSVDVVIVTSVINLKGEAGRPDPASGSVEAFQRNRHANRADRTERAIQVSKQQSVHLELTAPEPLSPIGSTDDQCPWFRWKPVSDVTRYKLHLVYPKEPTACPPKVYRGDEKDYFVDAGSFCSSDECFYRRETKTIRSTDCDGKTIVRYWSVSAMDNTGKPGPETPRQAWSWNGTKACAAPLSEPIQMVDALE